MNFDMAMERAKLNVQLSDFIYWCKNSCKRKPGHYSCAIDAVFELFYYQIYPTFKIVNFHGNQLFCKMKEICETREQKFQTEINELRDLFWEVAMRYCTSLHPKGTANAEVSEILHKLFDCINSKQLFGEAILSCDSCNAILKKAFPVPLVLTLEMSETGTTLQDKLTKINLSEQICSCQCKSKLPINNGSFLLIEIGHQIMSEMIINKYITFQGNIFEMCGGIRGNFF